MEQKKISFSKSIKTRLVLIMVALVAVPLILSIIISVVNTRSSGTDNAEAINDAQSHIVEQSILAVVDKNLTALQSLATSPSTEAYVAGDKSDEAKILTQMKSIDTMMDDGNSTVITGGDGKQLLRTVGDVVDVADREYFKQAMAGNVYISDIVVSKSTGSNIVTFAVPVSSPDGSKIIGIVQRNFDLSVFHDLLASEVTEDKQELLIVDRQGMVIAHSGHEITPDNPEDQSGNPFYTESRSDSATTGKYETTWDGDTWMVSWVKEAQTGWVVASCRVQSVALAYVTNTTLMMVVIGILFFIIASVVAFIISKTFTGPLKEINTSMEELSSGRFRHIEKYTARQDEFGAIINETNTVIKRLDEIVLNIKNSTSEVNDAAVALADTTEQISLTAKDVSTAVQEIADGATQQADEIQDASSSTTQISDNIQIVTDDAGTLKTEAVRMDQHSQESADLMRKLRTITQEMSSSIDSIVEKISDTGKGVENISGKVEAINSIASQTNLLALNASIEAARAGEAGKGFAVVAEEIGHLADDSAASADEIKVEMDKLQRESKAAIEQADEVKKATEDQMAALTEAIDSIRELVKEISGMAEGVDTILSAAGVCDESKVVIVDAMGALSSISQQNAAASEQTSASMDEFTATISSMTDTAESLRTIAETLSAEMEFFNA